MVVFSAMANQGLQSLLDGGYTQQEVAELRDKITQWASLNGPKWKANVVMTSSYHIKFVERAKAKSNGQDPATITVTLVEAD